MARERKSLTGAEKRRKRKGGKVEGGPGFKGEGKRTDHRKSRRGYLAAIALAALMLFGVAGCDNFNEDPDEINSREERLLKFAHEACKGEGGVARVVLDSESRLEELTCKGVNR